MVILSIKVVIKLIIFSLLQLIVLSFIVVSCGNVKKNVAIDDISIDTSQFIVFKNGWGSDYNYPIILDLSNEIIEEDNEILGQIQNAIDTWNNAIGKKILSIRTGVNTYTGNSFPSLYSPFNVSFKGIYFDKITNGQGGWKANTGKDVTSIATTIFSFKSKDKIDSVNLRFNRDTYVFGDTKKISNSAVEFIADMESVTLHELGHILGLGHAMFEPNSVMFPYIAVGPDKELSPTTSRCLSIKDVERVREIYPGGQEAVLKCTSN